jgi:hypothetical protein
MPIEFAPHWLGRVTTCPKLLGIFAKFTNKCEKKLVQTLTPPIISLVNTN